MWEIAQFCTVLHSAAAQNDTVHPSWKKRRSWCSSLLSWTPVWLLSVAIAGQRLMKLGYGLQLAPRHSPVGKMHPAREDHPHTVSLKWWLGCVKENTASSTQLSPAERHKYAKVLLPCSCLLKNASNPLIHEGCEMLWTRCNADKSINFQLCHATQSSIIRFISGLLIFLYRCA